MIKKICAACGNDYDKTFEVIAGGHHYNFDCLECAIQILAPKCAHCDLKILGHGVEVDETFYCSAHCARESGNLGLTDRLPVSNHLLSSALHP